MKKLQSKTREKELKTLSKKRDSEIDFSDIPPIDAKKWRKHAVVGKFYRPLKKQISIRIDMDVLDWFKHRDDHYQKIINEALREYMRSHL